MKISFTVNKGGVGKTTSACAICQILGLSGYKVLMIDSDPQGNTSRIFGIKEDIPGLNYEDLYCKQISKEEVEKFVVASNFENVDIIPSSSQMLEMNFKVYDAAKENAAAKLCFKNNLALIENKYDFVLIDNAPAIDCMSDSSMAASDMILIPINTDNLSYEGIHATTQAVEKVNKIYNLNVQFGGVFMTRVKKRTTLYKDLVEGYKELLGDYFIPISISDCNAVAEANTAFIPLYLHSRKCTAFLDYVELISHFNIMDKKHYQNLVNKVTK